MSVVLVALTSSAWLLYVCKVWQNGWGWPRQFSLKCRQLCQRVNKHGVKGTTSEKCDSSEIRGEIELPTRREDSLLMQPLKLRGLTLKNRLVRAAAFGGSSIDAMHDCHVEVALGGAAMSTLAYTCVSSDGRTFASQLVMTSLTEEQRARLRRMNVCIHKAGGAISIQLTHAGGFANHAVIGRRQKAPSSTFSPANLSWSDKLSREDLDRISNDFAASAKIAVSIGFDAIEIHCGHGYLLSQFLSPSRNTRSDEYGGDPVPSAEDPSVYVGGRFTFPLRVIREVRSAVGETCPIIVKLNVDDGFKSGLNLDQACLFARACEAASCDCIVPSCGYVDMNGFHMLRGHVPLSDMVWAIPGLVEKLALLLFGTCLVPKVPFNRQFLRSEALAILKSVKRIPVALLGGVRTWHGMEEALSSGFSLIQTARTLIREPDFILKIEAQLDSAKNNCMSTGVTSSKVEDVISSCTHCNACVVATLAEGLAMRCPLRDGERHFLDATLKENGHTVDIEDLFVHVPRNGVAGASDVKT